MNAPCRSNSARVRLFNDEQRQHEARAVCHECPILAACRAETLRLEAAGNPVHGVAGGLLPSERPHAVRMRSPYDERHPPSPAKSNGRPRTPCGTETARRRHRRSGEFCDVCGVGGPPVFRNQHTGKEQPCGTRAAARRHERAREPVCDACREARRAYNARFKAATAQRENQHRIEVA